MNLFQRQIFESIDAVHNDDNNDARVHVDTINLWKQIETKYPMLRRSIVQYWATSQKENISSQSNHDNIMTLNNMDQDNISTKEYHKYNKRLSLLPYLLSYFPSDPINHTILLDFFKYYPNYLMEYLPKTFLECGRIWCIMMELYLEKKGFISWEAVTQRTSIIKEQRVMERVAWPERIESWIKILMSKRTIDGCRAKQVQQLCREMMLSNEETQCHEGALLLLSLEKCRAYCTESLDKIGRERMNDTQRVVWCREWSSGSPVLAMHVVLARCLELDVRSKAKVNDKTLVGLGIWKRVLQSDITNDRTEFMVTLQRAITEVKGTQTTLYGGALRQIGTLYLVLCIVHDMKLEKKKKYEEEDEKKIRRDDDQQWLCTVLVLEILHALEIEKTLQYQYFNLAALHYHSTPPSPASWLYAVQEAVGCDTSILYEPSMKSLAEVVVHNTITVPHGTPFTNAFHGAEATRLNSFVKTLSVEFTTRCILHGVHLLVQTVGTKRNVSIGSQLSRLLTTVCTTDRVVDTFIHLLDKLDSVSFVQPLAVLWHFTSGYLRFTAEQCAVEVCDRISMICTRVVAIKIKKCLEESDFHPLNVFCHEVAYEAGDMHPKVRTVLSKMMVGISTPSQEKNTTCVEFKKTILDLLEDKNKSNLSPLNTTTCPLLTDAPPLLQHSNVILQQYLTAFGCTIESTAERYFRQLQNSTYGQEIVRSIIDNLLMWKDRVVSGMGRGPTIEQWSLTVNRLVIWDTICRDQLSPYRIDVPKELKSACLVVESSEEEVTLQTIENLLDSYLNHTTMPNLEKLTVIFVSMYFNCRVLRNATNLYQLLHQNAAVLLWKPTVSVMDKIFRNLTEGQISKLVQVAPVFNTMDWSPLFSVNALVHHFRGANGQAFYDTVQRLSCVLPPTCFDTAWSFKAFACHESMLPLIPSDKNKIDWGNLVCLNNVNVDSSIDMMKSSFNVPPHSMHTLSFLLCYAPAFGIALEVKHAIKVDHELHSLNSWTVPVGFHTSSNLKNTLLDAITDRDESSVCILFDFTCWWRYACKITSPTKLISLELYIDGWIRDFYLPVQFKGIVHELLTTWLSSLLESLVHSNERIPACFFRTFLRYKEKGMNFDWFSAGLLLFSKSCDITKVVDGLMLLLSHLPHILPPFTCWMHTIQPDLQQVLLGTTSLFPYLVASFCQERLSGKRDVVHWEAVVALRLTQPEFCTRLLLSWKEIVRFLNLIHHGEAEKVDALASAHRFHVCIETGIDSVLRINDGMKKKTSTKRKRGSLCIDKQKRVSL